MAASRDTAGNDETFSRIDSLFRAQEYDQARAMLEAMLEQDPDQHRALHALGTIACEKGDLPRARALVARALELDPGNASYCNSMGNILKRQGEAQEARLWFRRAVEADPDLGVAQFNLGELDLNAGDLDLAVSRFERAASLMPAHYPSRFYLGVANLKMGQRREALGHFEKAIEMEPSRVNGWMGAVDVINAYHKSPVAEDYCRRGLLATGGDPMLQVQLGLILMNQGRIAEAKEQLRLAMANHPTFSSAYTCLLFALNYDPEATQEEIFAVARAWDEACCAGAPRYDSYANSPDPERPLRIGYVSADMRIHPVGYLLLPVLRNYDRSRFSVVCYSNNFTGDEVTREFVELSDGWRIIAHLNDRDAAELIRGDGIDILIDLNGHTSGDRLPLFAHKPAPVQASWLGYCNTTGLSAMDYLITDDATVPTGEEHLYAERVLRLPWSRFCFAPPPSLPEVTPPPSLSTGTVTFGSFNSLAKINDRVVALWSRILLQVPNSRLLLKRGELAEPEVRDLVLSRFAEHGIGADRLDLRGASAYPEMLAQYGEVDIALDPFPFSGGLSTLDAFMMGVPVVTLSGKIPISRQTRSFLRVLNLLELVARTEDRYCAIACDLARDTERMQTLRGELRERLFGSYLCDGKEFTRNLENAYQSMWRNWCGKS